MIFDELLYKISRLHYKIHVFRMRMEERRIEKKRNIRIRENAEIRKIKELREPKMGWEI